MTNMANGSDIYVEQGIIPLKYRTDGVHIAVASVNDLDVNQIGEAAAKKYGFKRVASARNDQPSLAQQ
jgi:hypothetical protein